MSLISGRLILDHMLLPGKFRRNQIWSSKTKAGNKCALILSLWIVIKGEIYKKIKFTIFLKTFKYNQQSTIVKGIIEIHKNY